jgi:LacI family transcriptional regulator
MTHRPTVKDVARLVGVHASTVSRALNPDKRARLSEELVARVLEAAEQLGYRTNVLAASLRTRRSMAVGVVIPDITNPVFPPILMGIEDALQAQGYISVVANTANDSERARTVVEQLSARRLDGLILATALRRDPLVDLCLARGMPAVFVNRRDESRRIPSVVSDDEGGIHLAVEHLVRQGHRRIAHIAGPSRLSTGFSRRRGFEFAMAELAQPADPRMIVEAGSYSREAGRQAFDQLFRQTQDFTAIVTSNDLVAIGCCDAMRAAGLACPDDISVTGYNDMPMVDVISPPLTTVRIQHHEMGAEAARVLIEMIEKRDRRPVMDIILKPDLVVRGSAAPPRSNPMKSRPAL